VRPVEQRRIRTFVPTVNPRRGSVGPKVRTCLPDLFGAGGSGLSKISPRALLVSLFATVFGALAFAAVPAFASKPETPEVHVLQPTSAGVVLNGELNPGASEPREAGTYQYVYRPSTTGECEGSGATRAPEQPAVSLGSEHEELPVEFIGGLEPGTEYAICLVATEAGKTEAVTSPAVSFTTLVLPETPAVLPASGVTAASARANAILNPTKPGHENESYLFVYREGASQCQGPGSHELELLSSTGEQAEHVSALITGLAPHTTYVYCAIALNAAFESTISAEQVFETPVAPPVIAEESVAGVGPTEATVAAEINPGGLLSSYDVEYEPGVTTPEESLPASSVPVAVRQRITGLQAGTQYRFRFRAHNELGPTEGTLETLSTTTTIAATGSGSSCANATFLGFGPSLPDCRAAELVSPSNEVGEVYDPGGEDGKEQDVTTARPFRAAESGDAVVYLGDPGPSGGDGSSAKANGNEYRAERTPTGWVAQNINPPILEEKGKREFEAFSADLSVGILGSEAPLIRAEPSPQVPAKCAGLYSSVDNSFEALFSETSTPEECGAVKHEPVHKGLDRNLMFAGESDDHTARFFESPAALKAPATPEVGSAGGNIYESVKGVGVNVVNILPDGAVEPHSTVGGPSEYFQNAPDFSHAVSPDGERVFWSAVADNEGAATPVALYARENPASSSARTTQIDKAEPGAPGPSGDGRFWTANRSGSRVFFTDCNRLTVDSTADSSEGCVKIPEEGGEPLSIGNDLYVYEYARPEGARLVDLTHDEDGADPHGADVQGVLGQGDNGDYIYFVAGGALGAGANSKGELPSARTCSRSSEAAESEGHLPLGRGCNLFVVHYDGTKWESPRYIAPLAAIDNNETGRSLNAPQRDTAEVTGDWIANLGSRTAEATPDGDSLVFSSTQQLTGYDTSSLGRLSAEYGTEIFVYDYSKNRLACASCDPAGAPPHPEILASNDGFFTHVPVSSSETFMHRWVNDSGTEVYFDSSQPLVSGDSNGAQDVYEWEAEGSPSCPRSTSLYGGCVFLLSGGESPDSSFLVDADASGENVFIAHRGPLSGAGPRDDKSHLYDVRVGGGVSVSSLGCAGTGCQGVPPAAPLFATPASVTFSGVGNFPPVGPAKRVTKKAIKCAKGKKLSHGKCVKTKGKKKKIKKANHGKGSK
jgi:hypothetical protein